MEQDETFVLSPEGRSRAIEKVASFYRSPYTKRKGPSGKYALLMMVQDVAGIDGRLLRSEAIYTETTAGRTARKVLEEALLNDDVGKQKQGMIEEAVREIVVGNDSEKKRGGTGVDAFQLTYCVRKSLTQESIDALPSNSFTHLTRILYIIQMKFFVRDLRSVEPLIWSFVCALMHRRYKTLRKHWREFYEKSKQTPIHEKLKSDVLAHPAWDNINSRKV